MKVIGIAGPMRSGKTTTGQLLAKMFHGPVHHHSFASPVKQVANFMGWNNKKDEKGRRLLQLIGTDCGRECIDLNIWIDKWVEQIQWAENQNRLILVDDVRFSNEVQLIHSYHGILIKIENRGEYSSHSSEQELANDLFDLQISNDSTLEQLQQSLQSSALLGNFLNATTP